MMNKLNEELLDELIEERGETVSNLPGGWSISRGGVIAVLVAVAGLVLFSSLQEKYRFKQSVIAQHYHPTASSSYQLSPLEQQHLLYMREEEKLARDVYQHLNSVWSQRIFFSISQSEERHTRAIARLLKQFSIADPALHSVPGVFQNADLAKLYQTLTQRGEQSLIEALRVGALIEEVDIKDLDIALGDSKHRTVSTVYQRIRSGSYHHLRAFVHAMEVAGERYQAQVLPQKRVDMIINQALAPF